MSDILSQVGSRVGDYFDRTLPFGRGWEERNAHNERMQGYRRTLELKSAQDALQPKLTPAESIRLQLDALRGKSDVELESLSRSGQILNSLLNAKLNAETASTKALEAARTDNTRSLEQTRTDQGLRVLDALNRDSMSHRQLDEQRYQDTLALARQQQAENLQLQKDQLSGNRTMGLLTSLLGTGLAAAALFG